PMHLYRPWIRLILGWLVPLGFVAYVPSLFLLDAANPLGLPSWFVWLPAPVAAASCTVAAVVWRAGIGRYQSAGS
ncbi:MAG: ABC-2 family transporter protein, partial [Acidimicrobiales bacterium]